MKINKPRHPIVIVGAGLAGLAAADTLRELGVPHLVLERFSKPGGRLSSRRGEGWVADHGAQFIKIADHILMELIRRVGMERERVTVQGSILRLKADGSIETPRNSGMDPDRVCIDEGFGSFMGHLANSVNVQYDRPVGAIRWDNDDKTFWWQKEGNVFWFEDEAGEALRDPVTHDLVLGSGVILATTATAARAIAEKSPSIGGLATLLKQVRYTSTFTGIYKLPRQKHGFYALQGDRGSLISWLGFEENKNPRRIDEEFSLMVVQANPSFSAELMSVDDLRAMTLLYEQARRAVPALPEYPTTQTFKRWNVSQLETAPLARPENGWPINPPQAPFALAGDYLRGARAEDAAQSGVEAAYEIVKKLPKRHAFLGLELKG
ncbi:FAD-dependent oxidoreductase [soil metagenome]